MDLMTRRRALLSLTYSESRLPAEYQEVEYLETTGTQYINTGNPFYGSAWKVVAIARNKATDTDIRYLFGLRTSYDTNVFTFGVQNNDFAFYYNDNRNVTAQKDNAKHTLTCATGIVKIDDTIIGTPNISGFTDAIPFTIFNIAQAGMDYIAGRFWIGELYELEIYNGNGVLRHQYVPCYRKSDGEAGLYDTVIDSFYTNAGTGEFTVGANVN